MALTLNLKRTGMAAHLERVDYLQDAADLINNKPERHVALEQVKEIMGGDFHGWFNEVHKLRSAGNQQDYEDAIFKKLEELTSDNNTSV
jgi:hypothetical protein